MNFAPSAASPLEDSSSEEPSAAQLPLQSSHITPPQSENDYQPECPTTFGSSQSDGPPSSHSQDPIPIPSNDEKNPIPVPPLAHQQTPAAAVVQLQPFSGAYPAKRYPTNHIFCLSIALNIMFVVCCFLPGLVCSLPALILSIQGKEADKKGDYRRAGFRFRISFALNIVAIMFWTVIIGTAIAGFIGLYCYAIYVCCYP